jgi:hypothetical protein
LQFKPREIQTFYERRKIDGKKTYEGGREQPVLQGEGEFVADREKRLRAKLGARCAFAFAF